MQPHRENEDEDEQRNDRESEGRMPTLDWRNRDEATRAAAGTPLHILREVPELGVGAGDAVSGRVGPDRTRPEAASPNLLVHGDNLAALKALLPFAAGTVKCIYIDPPYNTGSAFEHYDDNLEHSTWLSLMYPRLELLREFLSEDGSIWISIDDREGAYLQVICDEIYGRPNFVANIAWQRTYARRSDSKGIPVEVEHILVYSKRSAWVPKRLARTEKMDANYTSEDGDPRPWSSVTISAPGATTHTGMVYGVQHPITGEMMYPPPGRCWSFGQPQMLEQMNEWAEYERHPIDDFEKRCELCGRRDNVPQTIDALVMRNPKQGMETAAERYRDGVEKKRPWPFFYFTGKGRGGIRRKQFLDETAGRVPSNYWPFDEVGHTGEATAELAALFDGRSPFATPKPERLIQRILQIATNPGDLVLDSFLGSGTTAAVAHKMGRRWIGVELGEHARTHCAVRLRKVIEGEQGGISKAVGWKGGGSFRFLELGEELLDGNGAIRESIPWEILAAHVWWKETKTGWGVAEAARQEGSIHRKSPVLGVRGGVAYALLYNGILKDRRVDGGNVLTKRTLALIREDLGGASFDSLVVYAEWSKLGAEALAAERIVLKQTPYDLDIRK